MRITASIPTEVIIPARKPAQREIPESCGLCRYYLAYEDDDNDDDDEDDVEVEVEDDEDGDDDDDDDDDENEAEAITGVCRRYPPQPITQGICEFPGVVAAFDWCGEFIPAS